MRLVTGKVVEGKVVVEGDPLKEGSTVTVLAPEDDRSFELTPEQEELLLQAHSKLEALQGKDHPLTRRAIQGLVDLYTALEMPEKAAEYQALLESSEMPVEREQPAESEVPSPR